MKRALVLCALFAAAPAFGQSRAARPVPTKPTPTTPAPSKPEKPQIINITDDDVVEGGAASPDGVNISVARRAIMPGMLKPRANFVAEMIKSADDI